MIRISKEIQNSVLKKYCRAIVHMRQENDNNRFGLILGAGVSNQFGFPIWRDLIEKIAKHPDVNAEDLLGKTNSDTSLTQLLYQQYRSRRIEKENIPDPSFNKLEMTIKADWHKIVRELLYENVPKDFETTKKSDKYLQNFLELMKNRVTINHNFDDTVEQFLASFRTDDEKDRIRGFKTIWCDNIPILPETSVIYHPNGFLPRDLSNNPSPDLVLLEDSFEDRLIGNGSGHYAFLVNHLAQVTCLFIGHSLQDPTVRHLLRNNALNHPGQYHYFISFVNSHDQIPEENKEKFQKSVSDSNFEVYNLITLFLNSEEIAALGYLLNISKDQFSPQVQEVGEYNVYKFFLTGSVSVGKSTVASHFKNLTSHDEWLDPLPDGMEKDPNLVEEERIKKIDQWVANQVGKKNLNLSQKDSGIHIIDRCPLDAFAFTEKRYWKEKAILLQAGISPGESNRKLCPGHIIFMTGDPAIIAVRSILKHRVTDAEKLKKQQEMLNEVYGKNGNSVTIVDTRDKSIPQVVKDIARIIYNNEYVEAPMDDWLNKIKVEGQL